MKTAFVRPGGYCALVAAVLFASFAPSASAQALRWNEFDSSFRWPAIRSWRNSLSSITASGHTPHHNGYDLLLRVGNTAGVYLDGKFHYGDIRKDLEGEPIALYVRKVNGFDWTYLGDGVTDSDGRVRFGYPSGMTSAGTYFVRMVVYGDLSYADMTVKVLGATTPVIFTDIDGTLTTSDEEMIQQTLTDFLDYHYLPRQYPDANKVMAQFAAQGYHIVYCSARPYWLTRASREWLMKKGYPHGHVYTYTGSVPAFGSTVVNYKRDIIQSIKANNANIRYAFGNASTDIEAYAAGGIAKSVTYIIGPEAGKQSTIRLPSYTSLLGSLVPAVTNTRRVVLLVVDGLRPDALSYYINNMAPSGSALKRLFGTRVDVQSATAAPSVTFTNHASIVTGRQPKSHGIVGNMFLDRATRTIYSFVGDTGAVDDVLAVYNNDGLGNRALQVQTIYEQMSGSGKYGLSAAHMFFKGAEYLYPSEIELTQYLTNAKAYDRTIMDKVLSRLDTGDVPDMITVYLPGLDHLAHEEGRVGTTTLSPLGLSNSQLEYLSSVIDPQAARLETKLNQLGVQKDAAWIIVSDHGHRDVVDDDAHAIGLDPTGFDNELEDVLEDSVYDDCYDKPLGLEGDFDCFAGTNGGLLHISLLNRSAGGVLADDNMVVPGSGAYVNNMWTQGPRFQQDMVPVLASIQQHRLNGEFFQNGTDVIEDVLVRQTLTSAYEVVRPTRVRVAFDTIRVNDDNDTDWFGAQNRGECYFDLNINGKTFRRVGLYEVNSGTTVTVNQSFDIDLFPGQTLNVSIKGEEDDGVPLIWDGMGTASRSFTDRSQIGGSYTIYSNDDNDFQASIRVTRVALSTDTYTDAPGWGELCPLAVLSGDYVRAAERIAANNHRARSGDIILLPKFRLGYYFGGRNKANHGSLYPEDSYQTFAIGGPAVTGGRSITGGSVVDIAPTIAAILGIELRGAEGVSRISNTSMPVDTTAPALQVVVSRKVHG